jgi:Cdc6-like AAA superfamily ATPase
MTRAFWLSIAAACLPFAAGCGDTAGWSKAGADQASARQAYDDCRGAAETAVRTDADIDQDILASRASDSQRASIVRNQTNTMREHTRDRAASIIEACMGGKGFHQPKR